MRSWLESRRFTLKRCAKLGNAAQFSQMEQLCMTKPVFMNKSMAAGNAMCMPYLPLPLWRQISL